MSDEMENENYKMICNLSNRARFRFTSPYEVSMKRRCLKRRGLSPKIFPRKVLVTEDIVTSHLNQLHISNNVHNFESKQTLSLEEIESRIIDSDDEEDPNNKMHVIQISKEYQDEINKFKKEIWGFQPKTPPAMPRLDPNTAVVLWKPPPNLIVEAIKQRNNDDKPLPDIIQECQSNMNCQSNMTCQSNFHINSDNILKYSSQENNFADEEMEL